MQDLGSEDTVRILLNKDWNVGMLGSLEACSAAIHGRLGIMKAVKM